MIVVAQILGPGDFGLVAIAFLALSIFEVFTKAGFQESLIQKQGDIETYLNSIWTVLLLRGFILYGLIFTFSPFISSFFIEPRAENLIKVISLVLILRGCTNIGVIFFQKDLEFKKQFFLDLSKTLPDFIITIILVIILRNIWALAIGILVAELTSLFVSFLIHPYKPKLELKKDKISNLLKFGGWVLVSNILVFLITQGDDIFVGKFLGVISLGYYQIAYNFANISSTEIAHTITSVTFPAYSKLQNNLKQLKNAFKTTLIINSFISFLINGLIFTFAPDFIKLFLGEKWFPILGALRFLSCWSMIRSIVACISPVFYALNKPEIITKYQFFLMILIFSLIYPLTSVWNLMGTALAIFISGLIIFFFRVRKLIKLIEMDRSEFVLVLFFPFIVILCLSIFFLFLKSLLIVNMFNFFIILIIYISIYIGLMSIVDKIFNFNLFKVFFKLFRLR